MQIEYKKEYSYHLGREVEYKRYGHAGKPVLVFLLHKMEIVTSMKNLGW